MNVPLYRCQGPAKECLYPLPLARMRWGCALDESKDYRGAGDYPNIPQERLLRGERIECPTHPNLLLNPRCPFCGGGIDREVAPATAILGGTESGKTVYCAILSGQLEKNRLFNMTGIVHRRRVDRGRARNESSRSSRRDLDGEDYAGFVTTVYDGNLPARTQRGQHRKWTVDFGQQGWLNRSMTMTDMAGEIWEDAGDNAPSANSGAASLLYTEDALFLMRPPIPNNFALLARLVRLCNERGVLAEAGQSTVRELVMSLGQTLERWNYPQSLAGVGDRGVELAQRLAEEIVGEIKARLGNTSAASSLVDTTMQILSDDVNDPANRNAYGVMEGIAAFMAREKQIPNDQRIDYRLAVVFAQADLLFPGVRPDLQRYGDDLKELIGRSGDDAIWNELLTLCVDLLLIDPAQMSGNRIDEWLRRPPKKSAEWADPLAFVERSVKVSRDPRSSIIAIERLSDITAVLERQPDRSDIQRRVEERLTALLGGKRTDPGTWRSALRGMSARSRSWFLQAFDTDGKATRFVQWADGRFSEVGYFFASSLGRGTEYGFQQFEVEQHRQGVERAPTDDQKGADEAPTYRKGWNLVKRIRPGRDGTATPRPWGVLFPLIWLLAGRPLVQR